jgi:hypothetical protein
MSEEGMTMRGDDASWTETFRLVEVDALQGIPVYSPSGNRIGTLGAVIVHKQSGVITSTVLYRSSLFGLRKRKSILPWHVLSPCADREGFVLHLKSGDYGDAGEGTGDAEPARLFAHLAERPAAATLSSAASPRMPMPARGTPAAGAALAMSSLPIGAAVVANSPGDPTSPSAPVVHPYRSARLDPARAG